MTKKHSTKKALVASVLSLLLCFSMLVGTTFAWFTDSVTSGSNIIQTGTLDVDLVDEQGNSMEGQIIEFVAADGRAQDLILWEPGCTYETEPVYVVNNGTLDLKYEIIINGIAGGAKLLEAIEWTVTVGDVTTALEDLKGVLAAGEKTDAIVLTGHMKEEAGNEYQGLAASGISISVFATQLTSESDSFDNNYDDEAHLEYVYDDTKTAKENAAALQALIDTAVEGATIVVGAGTYDVSGISGSQIKLTKDNVTLLGKNGVIINDEGESGTNVQAVIKITGDNVTVSNIYAEDKGENTVILAFGNNVTVTNCTLKGYASSAWGQYLEAGVMIVANDVVNAPITKYTVTNNTFIDCNVSLQNGVGNGGNAEDLIISGNTFKNAGVFIEHNQTNSVTGAVESWHVTDILVLPTIENNVFESPSVWLGSTPFAMYLRVYRDNDVETMTPATYWTDFVANNVIMDYNGEKLSSDGKNALAGENGVQMRPNGKVQYYGLNFGTAVSDATSLTTALENGGEIVLVADIDAGKTTFAIAAGKTAVIDLNGHTISSVDTTEKNYGLINVGVGATLTINDSEDSGAITTSATVDSGWARYSSVISNQRGTVIVNGGTIEHKGGTSMSYAIDNLTNGKNTFAKTVINDGNIKSSYIGIRQFCNGVESENIVEINNGTITGSRRSVWMQNPNSNANTGTLTINGGTFNGAVLVDSDSFVVTIAASFNVVEGNSGLTLTAK